MKPLLKKRNEILEVAQEIAQKAQSEDRALTAEEIEQIDGHATEIEQIDEQIKSSSAALAKLAGVGKVDSTAFAKAGDQAGSLGEHAIREIGSRMAEFKNSTGQRSFGTTEFKAATDTHRIADVQGGVPIQVDRTVVQDYRPGPTIASWLGSGTMTSTAIQYYVEALREGKFEAVPELGLKPQLHYTYSTKTDAVTKIAGRIKVSDEMMEDLPFIVSEINGRLMYDLVMEEENQLLNGDGAGANLTGILNRSGLQVMTSPSVGANLDAIYQAKTRVQNATGLYVDGIVINPVDYEKFRLSKDGTDNYYGGGPFSGGATPPLWGTSTIVTPAIAAGTVLIGNGRQAATVYRKGGVRVESTNTNEDDFNYNRVSIRAEERIALAVRRPAAIVKLTLAKGA